MTNWWEDERYKRDLGADVTGHGHTSTEKRADKYCSECRHTPVTRKQVTCSDKCRKARQRRQEQARLALPLAMHELSKIRDSLKRRERVSDFIADLERLKAEIHDLLMLAGQPDALAKHEMLNGLRRR